MKNQFVALIALVIALVSVSLQFTRTVPKIGYAETTVLMSEFSEAIKARKEFEKSQKEWDSNLKALNDSLMSGMEKMKAQYDKASPHVKDSLRSLLQKRNDDLQRYTNAVKKLAIDKEKELMDPVVRKINSYMDLWGKEHGYTLILGTMSGGNILQADGNYNLTSKILKDLNETYKDAPAIVKDGPQEKRADSSGAATAPKPN